MNTFDQGRLYAAFGRIASMLPQRAPWYRPSGRARWASRWPGLLAALLAAALLVAFVQIVRASVDKGESRNRAVAARAERVWRCNMLQFAAQRAGCRAQVDAQAPAATKP